MISRNARYEQTQRDKGLVKLTVWVPASVAPDFKQAAAVLVSHRDYTVSSVRSMRTGRFMSIHTAPVTGDTGGAA